MASRIGRRRAAALSDGTTAYAERRAEIVAAAARIFRKKGFSAASLADIAEELGTDRASLYYYISSKDELFHEVVRDAAAANADEAEAVRDSSDPAPVKLERIITSLMASYATHYPYLFVYVQEDMTKVSDGKSAWARQMNAINHRYESAVVAVVQQGIDDGSLATHVSARVIANGIIGMVNWTHRWYHQPETKGSPTAAEIGAGFAELVLNGLVARR
jgi:TetR/AcrR family transcriptional regulator, cholesterol catabolism regulator